MKKPDGVIVIAIYYLLFALVFLIASCAVLFALVTALASIYEPVGAIWAAFGIGIGLLFCLIFLAGSVMAGWGLLKMKHWGRWAAIVLGGLQLLGFPVFTVIGGFIIYYLLRDDVVAAFDAGPAGATIQPLDAPDVSTSDVEQVIDDITG